MLAPHKEPIAPRKGITDQQILSVGADREASFEESELAEDSIYEDNYNAYSDAFHKDETLRSNQATRESIQRRLEQKFGFNFRL
jgi:hypothetical protein